MKLLIQRKQTVAIPLLREPTKEELNIINGKCEELSMFDLPDDLIDFDKEEIYDEDYSSNMHVFIEKPKII